MAVRHFSRVSTVLLMAWSCLALTASGAGGGASAGNWPYRPYARARAYLYNLDNSLLGRHAIVKDGRLDATVVGNGVSLTPEQAAKAVELTGRGIGGLLEGLSKSHIPHHGIVFFDTSDRPVASLTFCFDCESMRAEPAIPCPPIRSELSPAEIKRLQEILGEFKSIIRGCGLPVLNSPFDYPALAAKPAQ